MFTTEDTSSLPVPYTIFQEAKSHYLGQLIVTPEIVAKTIKAMADNESPEMDGISPRLPMETVEQISIIATVLDFGVVPFFNGKKQTSYHYLQRIREISHAISTWFPKSELML